MFFFPHLFSRVYYVFLATFATLSCKHFLLPLIFIKSMQIITMYTKAQESEQNASKLKKCLQFNVLDFE